MTLLIGFPSSRCDEAVQERKCSLGSQVIAHHCRGAEVVGIWSSWLHSYIHRRHRREQWGNARVLVLSSLSPFSHSLGKKSPTFRLSLPTPMNISETIPCRQVHKPTWPRESLIDILECVQLILQHPSPKFGSTNFVFKSVFSFSLFLCPTPSLPSSFPLPSSLSLFFKIGLT